MLKLAGNITTDGKLQVFNMQGLTDWRMKNAGKDVIMTLKLKRRGRSDKQNAYYWGVVLPLVTEAINSYGSDFTTEDTHEFLKNRFNTRKVEVGDEYELQMPRSTTELDTAEFESYCEEIRRFSSMVLGKYIPLPNEQVTIDFYLQQQ